MYAVDDAATPGEITKGRWHFSRGWVKAPGFALEFPAAVDDAAHTLPGLVDERAALAANAALVDEWRNGIRAQIDAVAAKLTGLEEERVAGFADAAASATPGWRTTPLGQDIAVDEGGCSFMYRYILRESCSQFDSLPPNIFVDIAVDEDATRVTRTNSSSWGNQVTEPFTTDQSFMLTVTNTSSYLYVGVVDSAWAWQTSNTPKSSGVVAQFYCADGELYEGNYSKKSSLVNLKSSSGTEIEVQVDMTAHTVEFFVGGVSQGTLANVASEVALFATFGGSGQYVKITSAGSAAERVLNRQIAAEQSKNTALQARLVAPVNHGWEWVHPGDKKARSLSAALSAKLFAEHAAGEPIVEHTVVVRDGASRGGGGKAGGKVAHLVLATDAVSTECFAISDVGADGTPCGTFPTALFRAAAAGGAAGGAAASSGAASVAATLSGGAPALVTAEQYLPGAHSISRPDLGVVETTPVMSLAGHFKFKAGTNGDFFTIKLGSNGVEEGGAVGHGAAFTFGCGVNAASAVAKGPGWLSRTGNDISIDSDGRCTRTNSSSWGSQVGFVCISSSPIRSSACSLRSSSNANTTLRLNRAHHSLLLLLLLLLLLSSASFHFPLPPSLPSSLTFFPFFVPPSLSSDDAQVTEAFGTDTTFSVMIENSSSDYLAIGIIDSAWGWDSNNYVGSVPSVSFLLYTVTFYARILLTV